MKAPSAARIPMTFESPDFTQTGYIGTLQLSSEQKDLAISVAKQRQEIALNGTFQKVAKIAATQWLNDLKGALAEVGLSEYLATVADKNGIEYELAELVSDKPVAKQDVTFGGKKFDIKGCATLIEGLTERDDKLLIINCNQHDKKYDGYEGYFWVKTHDTHQDIFYFTRAEVSTWERVKGKGWAGDYYSMKIPAVN